MKVLVCGAGGFIGRRIAAQLGAAGHEVVRGVSARAATALGDIVTDFVHDTTPARWTPRLAGIDAVVNAVGRLRDSAAYPLQAVHADTPSALFEAALEAGVARVVQISALGIDGSDTPYARTKLQAETNLARLVTRGLDATVLRPSVVYGRGGASTELFMMLARLPLLVLPAEMRRARIQPVHVADLAEAVSRLVTPVAASTADGGRTIDAVGATVLTMGDYIGTLRAQQRHGPARVVSLPGALTRLSATLGDLVPASPWCRQSLELLREPNVGDAGPLTRLLGREPRAPERFLATP